jgi:hypothetical protein
MVMSVLLMSIYHSLVSYYDATCVSANPFMKYVVGNTK